MPNSLTLNTLRDATSAAAHADFIRHNSRNDRTFGVTLGVMLTACALLPFASTNPSAATMDLAAAPAAISANPATVTANALPVHQLDTVVIHHTATVATRGKAATEMTTKFAAGSY